MDAPSDLGSPGAAPAPPRPEGPSGPRRLRRRPDDGHIAGVCAGVAEYFNVDPVLVRIAAVVLAFSGPGVIAYILAWIFVPADPGLARYGEPQAPIDRKDRATQIFGVVLLGLGVSVIWGDWWSPLHGWLFPLGLMALGAWLLFRPDRDDPLPPPIPPPPPVPPTPVAAPWAWPPTPSGSTTAPVDADDTAVLRSEPETDASPTDPDVETDTDAEPATPRGEPAGTTGADPTAEVDPTTVQPTTATGYGGSGGAGWDGPPAAPWDV